MSLQVYNKTDPPISVIVYNSPATFIGRDPSLGALYKQHLSTGTKTLLNVLNHPDKCFSTIECGYNALTLLMGFTEGQAVLHPGNEVKVNHSC